jgi:hypothetical protein
MLLPEKMAGGLASIIIVVELEVLEPDIPLVVIGERFSAVGTRVLVAFRGRMVAQKEVAG